MQTDPPERIPTTDVTTPRRLRTRAASLEQRARQLAEEAAVLRRAADELEAARKAPPDGGHHEHGLRERPPGYTVDTDVEMADDHALAIAKGQIKRLKAQGRAIDPLTSAAVKAGYAGFRGLARELGVGKSMMGKYRSGSRIPRSLAKKIERLTGFTATDANWPGGFKDE